MSLVTPKLYPMVNLEGLDLAEVDGTRVPGIYDKIRTNLTQENIEIFYNWYFADIILAPYRVSINTSTPNQYLINGVILVKSDDTVSITGHIYIPVIESLSVTENGTYNVPSGVDGFGPVVVDVPSVPPVLVELNATENGTYIPSTGQDGFSQVNVSVPIPIPTLVSLTANHNGTFYPGTGVDGFSSAEVDVQPTLEVLEATENGTYTPGTGVDGFSRVDINVASSGGLTPLHFDLANGYLNSGKFFPESPSSARSDVYELIAGHHYIISLSSPSGNRFRCAFFTSDPYYFTVETNGTLVGSDENTPSAYSERTYSPSSNGFLMVGKTNQGVDNLKTYVFDVTT